MKTLSLLLLILVTSAIGVAAQDSLEDAKAQYAAASYEEALLTLTRVDSPTNRVELEQYRAFCFIALGKIPEAERAVASLVTADPRYVPSANVASPKVLSLLSDMRKKELPAIARKLFEEGRTAFKDKDLAVAKQKFDLLLELLDDAALKGRPENEDLRILAQGFATLVTASPAAAAPATTNTLAKAPQPEPVAPAAVDVEAVREAVVMPPVALQQALPEWVPPDAIASSRDFAGAIRVIIGTDGRVKTASIHRPSYPAYDARLLQASRQWVYRPAMRNGEPVESEKIIEIQLRRRD
jgi:hypothetical protein